jgi:hypothetical protein
LMVKNPYIVYTENSPVRFWYRPFKQIVKYEKSSKKEK